MTYFKSLFFNFLAIFFANHMIPGIDVLHPTKFPHIQGDLIFAFALGFLLSLIYPLMRLFRIPLDGMKIGLVSFCMSFLSYAVINFLPVEIHVTSFSGFFWGALLVFCSSFLTNYLEINRGCKTNVE
jgi:uncharacterized membrane protein YvlD (DUF360 family)